MKESKGALQDFFLFFFPPLQILHRREWPLENEQTQEMRSWGKEDTLFSFSSFSFFFLNVCSDNQEIRNEDQDPGVWNAYPKSRSGRLKHLSIPTNPHVWSSDFFFGCC